MRHALLFWVFLSIGLGILGGIFFPNQMIDLQWVGQLFINLLKLLVLPLIFCALVCAITSIGSVQRLESIGLYTLIYVLLSVTIATIIGLTLLNIFTPGRGVDPKFILFNTTPADLKPIPFATYILSIFPPNLIAAAASYDILPIVIFSVVFAIACLVVGKKARLAIQFFASIRDVLVKMISWLMHLTPIGLFSLLGASVAQASLSNTHSPKISGLFTFILIFLCGLLLQILWQLFVLIFVARKNPLSFISDAMSALATAFATSSSMATLPVTLLVAKQQGINDEVSRFVLPFVTTINLSGTAMYEAISALFFCQILGVHLSLTMQVGVFITAIIAGMGSTGIPEGGLVTMVLVLRHVNIPTTAIGLLLPFDRILDRFRTLTNVWGDLICAATVDQLQKRRLGFKPSL